MELELKSVGTGTKSVERCFVVLMFCNIHIHMCTFIYTYTRPHFLTYAGARTSHQGHRQRYRSVLRHLYGIRFGSTQEPLHARIRQNRPSFPVSLCVCMYTYIGVYYVYVCMYTTLVSGEIMCMYVCMGPYVRAYDKENTLVKCDYWRLQNNCSPSDRFATLQYRIFALSLLVFVTFTTRVTFNAEIQSSEMVAQ